MIRKKKNILFQVQDMLCGFLDRINRSPFNNGLVIALVLFTVALIFRLLFFHIHGTSTIGALSISGIPFSDAKSWNDLALDIAQGKGITGVWSARRPFYPIFLALFYTWFGDSLTIAKMVNLLASALTIPFIFLIGDKVFNRLIGLFAALIVLFGSGYMYFALTIMTESVALLFLVISIYLLLLGLDLRGHWFLFLSGLFFALSNLTQSLTLLTFPCLVLCIYYLLRKRGLKLKPVLAAIILFTLGTLLTLSPWLLRQKLTHGIFAISDNLSDNICCATNPEFQNWTGALDKVAIEKGLESVKERYDYFMALGFENLKKFPYFFIKNFSGSFFQYMNSLNIKKGQFHSLFYNLSALFILFLFLLALPAGSNGKEIGLLLSLFLALAVFQRFFQSFLSFLIILLGMGFSHRASEGGYGIFLTSYLLCVGVVIAMVGGTAMGRMFLMVSWIFYLFYFFAFSIVFRFFSSKIIAIEGSDIGVLFDHQEEEREAISFGFESNIRKMVYYATLMIVIFFLVGGLRLLYLNNFIPHPAVTEKPPLSFTEKKELLKQLKTFIPSAISEEEGIHSSDLYQTFEYENHFKNHGRILVKRGEIDRYIYHLLPRVKIDHWSRLFTPRPYERSVFQLKDIGYFLFPGRIPQEFIDRELIFVGRVNIDTNEIYEGRIMVEGIAIISLAQDLHIPDLGKIYIAGNRFHQLILEKYRPDH